MHALPNGSASGTARLIACPAHLVFPHVHRADDKHTSRGRGIHGYARNVLAGLGVDDALAQVDTSYRETCRLLDWDTLTGDLEPSTIRSEVAYALNVAEWSARFIGVNIGREYGPLGPYEIPGTLDIEGRSRVTHDEVVRDIKTGWQEVEPAAENPQGLFFGAVKLTMTNASELEFAIAKVKPNGKVWLDTTRYTRWQVHGYLDRLAMALDAAAQAREVYVMGGTPDVTEGPHCEHCPAMDSCPAKTRLARAMLQGLEGLDVEGAVNRLEPQAAGRVYEQAHDRCLPILERIIDATKLRARAEPVPLSGDMELRELAYEKASWNVPDLIQLARAKGASDDEIGACSKETTVRQVRPLKAPHAARKRRGKAA
jgi:hypothetical protein